MEQPGCFARHSRMYIYQLPKLRTEFKTIIFQHQISIAEQLFRDCFKKCIFEIENKSLEIDSARIFYSMALHRIAWENVFFLIYAVYSPFWPRVTVSWKLYNGIDCMRIPPTLYRRFLWPPDLCMDILGTYSFAHQEKLVLVPAKSLP